MGKWKRICSDCGQKKEQVKDKMTQQGGSWRCGKCRQKASDKLVEKLNWNPDEKAVS